MFGKKQKEKQKTKEKTVWAYRCLECGHTFRTTAVIHPECPNCGSRDNTKKRYNKSINE